jgi:hypothetical protein
MMNKYYPDMIHAEQERRNTRVNAEAWKQPELPARRSIRADASAMIIKLGMWIAPAPRDAAMPSRPVAGSVDA